jgi:pimeloyl-ACP methyl ester carboxylesterase
MTIVFLHGVPESPVIWDAVRGLLPEESVALRLPGFGSARPPEIRDKDRYADWLAGELRAIGGPIDLVGHDWGGHLALRMVTAYDSVPVRSWVCDVAYGWHPDYQWHPAAALWQKSPEGEESLAGIRAGTPGTFGELLRPLGMTAECGADIDAAHGATMSDSILALYRSAWPNLHSDWGAAVTAPIARPGLLLTALNGLDGVDQGETLAQNADMARVFGARLTPLEGLSHYWMLQAPERAVETLRNFWAEAAS